MSPLAEAAECVATLAALYGVSLLAARAHPRCARVWQQIRPKPPEVRRDQP